MRRKIGEALTFAAGLLLIALLIQAAGTIKGDTLVFPDVPAILRAFIQLLKTPKTGLLLLRTLMHLVETLTLSMALGVTLGMLEGLNRWIERLLRPLMSFLRSLPMIVVIIMVMVLSRGYEWVPVIAPAVILVPLISGSVLEGCASVPAELIDVYRMNARLNLRVIFQVYFPLMAGYLRQTFTEAAGMGMKLVITAEYLVQTRDSLGKAVFQSTYFNEYQDLYAYAILMSILVLLLTGAPSLAARLFSSIRKPGR